MSTVLEHFSNRSKMVIFLTRKDAGRRGATALEPGDLLEAIINEDQGELAKRFVGAVTPSGPIREPQPFFSAEVAAKALLRLHSMLPQQEPVADSVDMTMSPSLQHILSAATTLAGELHHSQVQPLHLVAAILAEESGGPAEILTEAGISKEAVIQALGSRLE
jgi:ATP-dependent Clp protease ATP-binding subunit ClpA